MKPGPRGKDYCILCNPFGHGKMGTEGTEAIAEYYINPNRHNPPTGWQPICDTCLTTINWDPEFARTMRPLEGHENHPYFADEKPVTHECDNPTWTKASLVTEDGGFDWVQCDDCGIWAKRHGLGQIQVVGETKPS